MPLSGILYMAPLRRSGEGTERTAASYYGANDDRYIWELLTKGDYSKEEFEALLGLQERIARCCYRSWEIVKLILCDDSPEGYLPEEMEDVDGLDTRGLVSYSFRGTIESRCVYLLVDLGCLQRRLTRPSNAMRSIILPLRSGRTSSRLRPSPHVFRLIGALTFEQLSTLRHRGAFSTVAQTFAACCQLAQHPHIASLNADKDASLLLSWYIGTLDSIYAQESTTRRSAGIPALMTGILSANAEAPSFDNVLDSLEEIARRPVHAEVQNGSGVPQVHAMNCLRAVFRSSLLSKRAEPYFPRFLQLASGHLRSDVYVFSLPLSSL